MTTRNRRSSLTSSTSSSLAKTRPCIAELRKAVAAKKRQPLGDVTNKRSIGFSHCNSKNKNNAPPIAIVPCATKVLKQQRERETITTTTARGTSVSDCKVSREDVNVVVTNLQRDDVSPVRSDADSVSMDESMSSCDSLRSPDVEYVDNSFASASVVNFLEKRTSRNLSISVNDEPRSERICKRDQVVDMEVDDESVEVDRNQDNPLMCSAYACDIYKHLRASESKKRPSTDYMERVQKDINPNMRSILIDWLIEVAEEYRLVPDTVYLTVNYVDRYLSGNVMNRQQLQLLGVACMMIAAKYEEICAPQVEEFCYITDNTYFREEVLEMESSVLNFLKFEMTAPTTKCFLRRFLRVAQALNEVPSLQLESMANYIAELSLLEYNLLQFTPSLIASSSIFLARFILHPSDRPWNLTLKHYTMYQPSEMYECVKALHLLCHQDSSLTAIREKYSQHKYKCAAEKLCPSVIPPEYFLNNY